MEVQMSEIMEVTINLTIESLIDCGVLSYLDGEVGYNGILTVRGVSSDHLTQVIEDKVHEYISLQVQDEVTGAIGEII